MANLIMIRSGDDITLTNQILSPRATTNFPTAVAVLEPTSEAVDEQFKTAVLQALEMGARIYEKIGFESQGIFPMYFNGAH